MGINYEEQLKELKQNGIGISDYNTDDWFRQKNTIEHVGMFKLMEHATQLTDNNSNVAFKDLVDRYFRDQHLKLFILKAIEDIEVSVNSHIAYVLGSEVDSLNYRDFFNWCNSNCYNKYLKHYINKHGKSQKVKEYMDDVFIFKNEKEILGYIKGQAYQMSQKSSELFLEDKDKIPVELAMYLLTFGKTIRIICLMKPELQYKLADFYECSPDKLIKWLRPLNLTRNICCHNGNLIDYSFTTKPPLVNEYCSLLYRKNSNNKTIYSNKLACVLVIIVRLMSKVNSQFKYKDILNCLEKLVTNDEEAQRIGFKDYKSMELLFMPNAYSKTTKGPELLRRKIYRSKNISKSHVKHRKKVKQIKALYKNVPYIIKHKINRHNNPIY